MEYSTLSRYPRSLFLNISGLCNMKCIYCSSENVNEQLIMSRDFFLSVCDVLSPIVFLQYTITGGEPFLNSDLEFILYVLSKKAKVTVLTNGTLINNNMGWLRKFVKRGISFEVSIDAATELENSMTRKQADYEQILVGIEALCKEGFPVAINTVVTNQATSCILDDLVDMVQQKSVRSLNLIPLCPISTQKQLWDELQPSPKLIEHISQYDDSFVSNGFANFAKGGGELLSCGVGKDFFSIGVNGDIFPCNIWPESIGNIMQIEDIRDFWKYSAQLRRIREIKKMTVHDIESCNGCSHINNCRGGCRARAFAYTGSVLGADPYCRLKEQ